MTNNRHFLLDPAGITEEIARVNGLFSALGAFLTSRGISLPKP